MTFPIVQMVSFREPPQNTGPQAIACPIASPLPLPSAPWEKLAIDIVGPFETAAWNCRYALTLTDCYSKWPEVAFTA